MTNDKKEKLYLSWLNDFLTVEAFAAYYKLTLKEATDIINWGRSSL
jgi:hypothetical protein